MKRAMKKVVGKAKVNNKEYLCVYLLDEKQSNDPKWLSDHAEWIVKDSIGRTLAEEFVTITIEDV
jgi:hypothetical protein